MHRAFRQADMHSRINQNPRVKKHRLRDVGQKLEQRRGLKLSITEVGVILE